MWNKEASKIEIQSLELRDICQLNLGSHSSGANCWGTCAAPSKQKQTVCGLSMTYRSRHLKTRLTTARINLMIGLEQLQKRWLNFEDQPWCCGVGEVLVHSRGKGKLDSVFLFSFLLFFFLWNFCGNQECEDWKIGIGNGENVPPREDSKKKKKGNGEGGTGIISVQLIERDMDKFYGISWYFVNVVGIWRNGKCFIVKGERTPLGSLPPPSLSLSRFHVVSVIWMGVSLYWLAMGA